MIHSSVTLLGKKLMKALDRFTDDFTNSMVKIADILKDSKSKHKDKTTNYIQQTCLLISMLSVSMYKVGAIKIMKESNPNLSAPIRDYINKSTKELLDADPMGFNGKIDYFEFFDTLSSFIDKRGSDAEDRVLEIDKDILEVMSSANTDFDEACKRLAGILDGVSGLKLRKDLLDGEDKAKIAGLAMSVKKLLDNLGVDFEED